MTSRIPAWNSLTPETRTLEQNSLRTRAFALLKGCVVHWQRSLSKIKKIVHPDHLFRFESLIRILEGNNTTEEQLQQALEHLQMEYPEIHYWLSWWSHPQISCLIWPAVMKMSESLREKIPNTTNGGESSHWLLYRACGTKHDLWEGIRRLYMFQREQEKLYSAVLGMYYKYI